MDSKEFATIRKRLARTQKGMAEVLGTSVKAVHSYEQGWRSIPAHVEKQLLFLLVRQKGGGGAPCWRVRQCEPERKKKCPAWEFQAGDMCWFLAGTLGDDMGAASWDDKMKRCRECAVLDYKTLLGV
ncbi:two-CW domain-containing protein [Desulfoluna sp.]|uniref:helix-turn-helix domain-containing protein n=1 Tax=Desulfoluna sp. TaxID=2045199 RepID=UPI00260C3B06|nr:transcriptional regulator [Desulfoluna sp.]